MMKASPTHSNKNTSAPAADRQTKAVAQNDHRPAATVQRQLQAAISKSPRQLAQRKQLARLSPAKSNQPPQASSAAAPVQRRLAEYRNSGQNSALKAVATTLDSCVAKAKSIVDSNPLLEGVGVGGGYLERWVKLFREFLKTGEVPEFFYAGYGYAIETLAAHLLPRDFGEYKVATQVTSGSTRPDFVVMHKSGDRERGEAWIDITSEASAEHIYAKQGGGWKTKAYVAEVLYSMPKATDFATSAQGSLSAAQVRALAEANDAQALREAQFTAGMQDVALALGNAFDQAISQKGEGLAKIDVKRVTLATCREVFSDKISPKQAASILAAIDELEIGGALHSGAQWAKWAFDSTAKAVGKELLQERGRGFEEAKAAVQDVVMQD